jgi:hypothetical protein
MAPAVASGDVPASPEARDDPPAATALGRVDVVIALVLGLLAAYVRRDSYPTDGLWLDDAWVGVSARAPLSDLLSVSWNHPGFTVVLQAVNAVAPDRVDVLAWPVLLGGVLGVPLLYLCCRVLGFAPIASLPVAAAVAVNRTHAIYSGRVKPYVFEVIGIAVLAVAMHLVVGRRWRWPVAVAWVALALAVSTTSAFGFAAAAVATLVVALHPAGDRAVRTVALVVQGAIQLASGLLTQSRYDATEVADIWEDHYDAYIEVADGPIDVLRQLLDHLSRLAQTWVEAPAPLALGVLGVAFAGLGWACVRGRHRAVARFLAALPLVAIAGSIAQQVPFGPTPDHSPFPGSRGSLWLYPSIGFGLAVAIHGVVGAARRLGERRAWAPPLVFGGAAAATLVLVVVKHDIPVAYGALGNQTATAHIESVRDDGDVVFFFESSRYIISSEPPIPIVIRPDRGRIEGFTPIPGFGRVAVPRSRDLTLERTAELVGDADRVFVHNSFVGLGDGDAPRVEAHLASLGFELAGTEAFGVNTVQTWTR